MTKEQLEKAIIKVLYNSMPSHVGHFDSEAFTILKKGVPAIAKLWSQDILHALNNPQEQQIEECKGEPFNDWHYDGHRITDKINEIIRRLNNLN